MYLLFVCLLIFIEVLFSPRLDFTRDGFVLLWYGRRNRKCFILWS